ncbi:MAG: nucleotidyltransferase domain-containing protein, partial [Methanosarcinales archaeon]
MKSKIELLPDDLIVRLSKLKGLIAIILFGSVARGDADKRSDVDLMLLFEDTKKIEETREETLDLLAEYRNLRLSLTSMSITQLQEDNFFAFEIFRDGKILYKCPRADILPASILGGTPSIIYTFSLKGMEHPKKILFNRALYGRKKGKYVYRGLLESIKGKLLGPGAVLVPANAEK